MYRATTVPMEVHLCVSFDRVDVFQLTFAQYGKVVVEITKDDLDIEENIGRFSFSQEQTKLFRKGIVDVQLRALDTDGNCLASETCSFRVQDVLHDNILEVEDGE